MYTIDIGNFEATKQKNGTFLYKAKGNGIQKKPAYKDPVSLPVLNTVEGVMKKDSSKMIDDSCIQILKFLAQL